MTQDKRESGQQPGKFVGNVFFPYVSNPFLSPQEVERELQAAVGRPYVSAFKCGKQSVKPDFGCLFSACCFKTTCGMRKGRWYH
jgi:hypothetical protein